MKERGIEWSHSISKTIRQIWPLLELLTKITRVLACSCSQNFCKCAHARILSPSVFNYVLTARKKNLTAARARKIKHTARMHANAHKDHSIPLKNRETAISGPLQ